MLLKNSREKQRERRRERNKLSVSLPWQHTGTSWASSKPHCMSCLMSPGHCHCYRCLVPGSLLPQVRPHTSRAVLPRGWTDGQGGCTGWVRDGSRYRWEKREAESAQRRENAERRRKKIKKGKKKEEGRLRK